MRLTSLLLVAALAGCSAGRAAVALAQADRAIVHAQSRGAAEQAAYELRMAQAYRTKAREEAHFSSYRSSVELSRGAADWADKAIIEMEKQGSAGARSNAEAPGGIQADPPDAAPTGKADAWTQPDVAPVEPTEPPATDTPPVAPEASDEPAGAVEPESVPPPEVIVVPVQPTPSATPAPRVRIIQRGPAPDEEPPEEAQGEDAADPEGSAP